MSRSRTSRPPSRFRKALIFHAFAAPRVVSRLQSILPEARMIATAENATGRYRVEVSGWDAHKSFFVENSDLDWSEQSGKRVTLNHAVTPGSVVFLRLLQPMTDERPQPVAYEAELIAKNEHGQRQFRLRPVALRTGRHTDVFR